MARFYLFETAAMPREELPIKVVLEHPSSSASLPVRLEAFFEFSFWIAEEVERLVDAYRPKHLPPPKAPGKGARSRPRERSNN